MRLKFRSEDRYSPNAVLLTVLLSAVFFCVLCAQVLWIPASRLQNLYLRSVVLSATDAIAAAASRTNLDGLVPLLRDNFLQITALSDHTAWDTRYYNRRSAAESGESVETPSEGTPVSSISAVQNATTPISDTSLLDVEQNGTSPISADSTLSVDQNMVIPVQSDFAGSVVHSAANPLRVLAFGDSQAYSLGNGLARLSGQNGPLAVEVLAVHSTGFIRGDYYSWSTKLEDTFRAQHYDAAVVMLGMNDYQNFYNSAGKALKKETAEWEAAYHERCSRIIELLLMHVDRVYWIGMPLVQNAAYNESLTYIDTVQHALATRYSPQTVVRIAIRDQLPGPGKAFTDTVTRSDGTSIRVMSSDGTHFTVEGGQLAMQGVFEHLTRDFMFSPVPVAVLP